MKRTPTADEITDLRERIDSLREQHRRMEQTLNELDREVEEIIPVAEARENAIGKLRGSVLWYGDIISPIDVEWDAER